MPTDDHDQATSFPWPAPGDRSPSAYQLKRWKGHGHRERLFSAQINRYREDWHAAVKAAGWVAVFMHEETGVLAHEEFPDDVDDRRS